MRPRSRPPAIPTLGRYPSHGAPPRPDPRRPARSPAHRRRGGASDRERRPATAPRASERQRPVTRRPRRAQRRDRGGRALRRAAPGAAQADRERARGRRRAGREVRRHAQGAARGAAQPEAVHHHRHRADLRRRLQPLLGLGVRRGLRGAAVHPRDGPRDRAAPRGDQGERANVHPLHGRPHHRQLARRQRARRGARGARRPDPRQPRPHSPSPSSGSSPTATC